MTASDFDATTGHPIFADGDAPDVAQNATEVAEFAASVGTRLIGSTSDRTGYSYAREGLRWWDTDEGAEYLYDGSGWKEIYRPLTAWTPSVTGLTVGNGTLTAQYERHGRIITGFITFTAGTTSSATAGIGIPLPVTPANTTITRSIGQGLIRLTSSGGTSGWPIYARLAGGASITLATQDASGAILATAANVSNTNPTATAWGTALPTFYVDFRYVAAS